MRVLYTISIKRLWATYLIAIALCSTCLFLSIKMYFIPVNELTTGIPLQLYPAVGQLKFAFEKLATDIKAFNKTDTDRHENIERHYSILKEKYNLILENRLFSHHFRNDSQYLALVKNTGEKVRSIENILSQIKNCSMTKWELIEQLNSIREVIALLDKRAYEIQLKQYQKILSTLARNEQILLFSSFTSWSILVSFGTIFLATSLKYRRIAVEKKEMIERKNIFFAAFKHELSNPLQSIIGAVDVLSEMVKTEEAQEFMSQLNYSAKQITAQMKDLSEYSRLDAGGLSIREKKFNIREIVHDILLSFEKHAQQKGIKLSVDIFPENILIIADYDRIRQIINNLVSNAIKFTEHGEIIIQLHGKMEHPTTLMIAVEDTGIGIAKENIPKIFEPFKQLSTTNKVHGMGLGLAIVKHVVNLLNGTIAITSSLGQGSRFVVMLPVQFESE